MSSASVKRELRTCLSAVSYTSRDLWSSVISERDWKGMSGRADEWWASHLEVKPEAPQGAMGVPYRKVEAQALSHEELQVKDVGRGCTRDVGRV